MGAKSECKTFKCMSQKRLKGFVEALLAIAANLAIILGTTLAVQILEVDFLPGYID